MKNAKDFEDELRIRLSLLAGAASVCWDETPDGVFEADRCRKEVEHSLKSVVELVNKHLNLQ